MQSQKRRQYTAEFKREAVRLMTEHGYGVTEAARNLGLHTHMLGRWKRQAAQHTNGSIGGNSQRSAEYAARLQWRKAH
jgi:transposase